MYRDCPLLEHNTAEVQRVFDIEKSASIGYFKGLSVWHITMTDRAQPRVFVVDDDVSVADTVTLVLCHFGFHVTTFYDPVLAVQHALLSAPDIVITDYSMPRMNGLELAAWLHNHSPHCKIVIITGEVAVVAAQENNGLKFTLLQKPVHPDVLLASIV